MGRVVTVINTYQENTKKDVYTIKHYSNGTNINDLSSGDIIKMAKCDVVHVRNDETGDDFDVTVIRDKEDNMYYTSSEYFTREIESIYDDFDPETDGEDGELNIRILKKQSKSRKMPNGEPALFLTCELV